MIKHQDLHNLEKKLKMTQRLLEKLDREFEVQTHNSRDLRLIMDKSVQCFQIYELCANEFCFELEIVQMPVVSLFFKHYIQSFHRQLIYFMKTCQESGQSSSFFASSKPGHQDDSLPSLQPSSFQDNISKDLFGNYDKINEITKQNLKKPVPVTVQETDKKEQKFELTNVLLKNELKAVQTTADQLKKQNDQLKGLVSKFEAEKQVLEEELLRTVRNNIISQNNAISAANRKPDVPLSLDDFLFSLQKQKPTQQLNKQGSQMMESSAHEGTGNEKTRQEEEKDIDDEQNFEELKLMLEKRDKTFEKVKDSGVAKELKRVLNGFGRKKKSMKIVEKVEQSQEVDEDEEEKGRDNKKKVSVLMGSIRKGKETGSSRKTLVGDLIGGGKRRNDVKEAGTQPDPLIFDIAIIDAQNFKISQLKTEIVNLKEDLAQKTKLSELKVQELAASKRELDASKTTYLELMNKLAGSDLELNKLKKELNEHRKTKTELEERLAGFNGMIDDLVGQIKTRPEDGDSELVHYKTLAIEYKQDSGKKSDEIRGLKLEIDRLNDELQLLKQTLEETSQEKQLLTLDFENLQKDCSLLIHSSKEKREELQAQLENCQKMIPENEKISFLPPKQTDFSEIEALEQKIGEKRIETRPKNKTISAIINRKMAGSEAEIRRKEGTAKRKVIDRNMMKSMVNVKDLKRGEKDEGIVTDRGIGIVEKGGKKMGIEMKKGEKGKENGDKIRENEDKMKGNLENREKLKENRENNKENKEKMKENRDNTKENKEKLKENRENTKEKMKENSEKTKENREKTKENDEKNKETSEKTKETAEKMKENGEKMKEKIKEKLRETTEKIRENSEKIKEKQNENNEKIREKNEKNKEIKEKIEKNIEKTPKNSEVPFKIPQKTRENSLKLPYIPEKSPKISAKPSPFSLKKTEFPNENPLKAIPNPLRTPEIEPVLTFRKENEGFNTPEPDRQSAQWKRESTFLEEKELQIIENEHKINILHQEREQLRLRIADLEQIIRTYHENQTNSPQNKLISAQNQAILTEKQGILTENQTISTENHAILTENHVIFTENPVLPAIIPPFSYPKPPLSFQNPPNHPLLLDKSVQTSFPFSPHAKKPSLLKDAGFFEDKPLPHGPASLSFDAIRPSDHALLNLNLSKLKEAETQPPAAKDREIYSLLMNRLQKTGGDAFEGLPGFEKLGKKQGFEDFQQEIERIVEQHRACGAKCPHLRRFYERIGFVEAKNGRTVFKIHRRDLSRLPKMNTSGGMEQSN